MMYEVCCQLAAGQACMQDKYVRHTCSCTAVHSRKFYHTSEKIEFKLVGFAYCLCCLESQSEECVYENDQLHSLDHVLRDVFKHLSGTCRFTHGHGGGRPIKATNNYNATLHGCAQARLRTADDYHVFISHRGPDAKWTFVEVLERELKQRNPAARIFVVSARSPTSGR